MKLEFVAPKKQLEGLDILTAILGGKNGVKILGLNKKGLQIQAEAAEPREPFASIFKSAFDILCQELGLADDPRTVNMSFLQGLDDSDGTTSNVDTDPFVVTLKVSAPWQVISTLAHEMIHVRDLAKGDLYIKDDDVYFHGKKVNDNFIRNAKMRGLDDLGIPHEREAYDKMWPLSLLVLNKLSPEHRLYLNKAYVDSLKPPTLTEFWEKRQLKRTEKVRTANQVLESVKAEAGAEEPIQALNSIYDII